MAKELDIKQRLIFDGAMGTMLQARGLALGEIPESYNIKHPEIIVDIHQAYIEAGCQVITSNTFGANSYKLKDTGYSVKELVEKGIELAQQARGNRKDIYIAQDISAIGQLMEPMGPLSFDEAYELFKEQIQWGEGADLILIETLSDLYETKAAVLAAKENSKRPLVVSMTFQQDGRTLTGTDVETMVNVLEGLGVDALGVNCSLGPKELKAIVQRILECAHIPVIVQPNAGLPLLENGKSVFKIDPCVFSEYLIEFAAMGVGLLGGCCGTTPAHLRQAAKVIKNMPLERNLPDRKCLVSSATQTLAFGQGVKMIGERINPTGKPLLREALKTGNMTYILQEAIQQKEHGAHLLDVNVGLPEINEAEVMVEVIKKIQEIIQLPLQIDSTQIEVLEKGVRYYNGKALINSVNGKAESMAKVFPIAKKYGACVLGLTLDERGIPASAEERLEIAKKIVETAQSYGIAKEDILIDCLVLTASAQQAEVKETLKAVRLVKERLACQTVLGVSNVSFGLPNRPLLNRTFLSAAMGNGLDAAIINPLDQEMVGTVDAFNVLWYYDRDAKYFIDHWGGDQGKKAPKDSNASKDLKEIVIQGMKEEAAEQTKRLLQKKEALEIVDTYLIPALDQVGKGFESGDLFLPQLIQSAETVKVSVDILKAQLHSQGAEKLSKGTVVLATVKGDIHDIGKNIVKILLENYGFTVIDLGKDVAIEQVVETVKREEVKLVGLSALMTTTVISMKETIEALRKAHLDCKVFVGGAVLNPEYAEMIGADFYARDARESVKIAQDFFGIQREG